MPAIAVDNFNRADNVGNMGTSWAKVPAITNAPNIITNGVGVQVISSETGMFFVGNTPPNDQYAKLLVLVLAANTQSVLIRGTPSGTTMNAYAGGAEIVDFGAGSRIWKSIANTFTSLAGPGPTPLAVGQTFWCEAEGTTLRLRLNGGGSPVELSVTDAALSGGVAGVYCNHTSLVAVYDDFEVGQLAASSAPTTSLPYSVKRIPLQQKLEASA